MNQRPEASEYGAYYGRYVSLVEGDDVLSTLRSQAGELRRLLTSLPPDKETFQYAPRKWSVRQLVGHVTDSERVFGYRALAFARGDEAPLPSFDENKYMEKAAYADVPLADIWKELEALRQANISMFEKFRPADWVRVGVASDNQMSTRAMAFVLAGHAEHHLRVLRERYGVGEKG